MCIFTRLIAVAYNEDIQKPPNRNLYQVSVIRGFRTLFNYMSNDYFETSRKF